MPIKSLLIPIESDHLFSYFPIFSHILPFLLPFLLPLNLRSTPHARQSRRGVRRCASCSLELEDGAQPVGMPKCGISMENFRGFNGLKLGTSGENVGKMWGRTMISPWRNHGKMGEEPRLGGQFMDMDESPWGSIINGSSSPQQWMKMV